MAGDVMLALVGLGGALGGALVAQVGTIYGLLRVRRHALDDRQLDNARADDLHWRERRHEAHEVFLTTNTDWSDYLRAMATGRKRAGDEASFREPALAALSALELFAGDDAGKAADLWNLQLRAAALSLVGVDIAGSDAERDEERRRLRDILDEGAASARRSYVVAARAELGTGRA